MRNRALSIFAVLILAILIGYFSGRSSYTSSPYPDSAVTCEQANQYGGGDVAESCRSHAISQGFLTGLIVAGVGVAAAIYFTRPR